MEDERMNIKLVDLRPNPFQPPGRIQIDEETARKFGESILEHGLLQLPVVRMVPYLNDKTCWHYEVGDGWLRRAGYEWLVQNGHPEYDSMPCILRGFTDEQMADLVIEANEVRRNLNPIDRAWMYQKYLDTFPKVTQAEFARRHGLSQSEISNTIRLLDLPETIKKRIISGEIKESHGRSLLRIKDPKVQDDFASSAWLNEWSVAFLEEKITQYIEAISPKMTGGTATEDKEVMVAPVIPPSPLPDSHVGSAAASPPQNDKKDERAGGTDSSAAPQNDKEGETLRQAQGERIQGTQPQQEKVITAAPATPARNWGRKLVLEEKNGFVMASCMKSGGVPAFKKIEETLEDSIIVVRGWLDDLANEWNKEGK